MSGDDLGRLAYLVILLVAVSGWVLVEFRGRIGSALRMALGWGLIFIGVAAAYGLWTDMRTNLPQQAVIADGRVEIPRAADGHYYLTLEISGRPVEFMVDTGATNVVLSRDDALTLGIDPTELAYLGRAETANGTVRTARVGLEDVTLGPWTDARLPAYVNDGAMQGSLLGMDYLGRFRIEIDGNRMVLTR